MRKKRYIFCEKAEERDNGRVYCSVSDMICAHVYFCQIAGRWKQLDSAKDCPGRSKKR